MPGSLSKLIDAYRMSVARYDAVPQLALLATELDARRPRSLVLSPQQGYGVTQADYDIRPNLSKIRKAVRNVFKTEPKAPAASAPGTPSDP